MTMQPDNTGVTDNRRARPRADRSAGFTLVELMVVVAVILIAVGIALPTIVTLVTAGAQEQAYNVFSAQLTSARALAIRRGTYAGVHVQPADRARVEAGDLPDRIYTAVVVYDRENEHFDVADGFDPRPLPGRTALGEISNTFVDGGTYRNGAFGSDDAIDDFTTFTIVFSPDGAVVRDVEGRPVEFNRDDDGFFRGRQRLWDGWLADQDGEGVWGVCIFDLAQLIILEGSPRRAAMLNEGAQFLPVNIHTGQVFPRL